MEPEDQQQKNQSQGFLRESTRKAKDEMKKSTKKKLLALIAAHPIAFAVIIGGSLAIIVFLILFAGFLDFLEDGNFKSIQASLSQAMSGLTQGGETADKTITVNANNGFFEIGYNVTDDDIEYVKEQLKAQGKDPGALTDYELKFITALAKSGLDYSDLTIEQLKQLPIYYKVEMATQNVDLRKKSEMYDDSTGTFKPTSINDLKEEQVQGVVHLKRTNTSGKETILEYIDKGTFDEYLKNSDTKALNYFTLDDSDNLVIATWSYEKIDYTFQGKNIPVEITNGKKNEEKYNLSSISIPYKSYIAKYTMPFEFLTAMLIKLEDVDFCNEIANLAQGSNIVIEVQEQMRETNTTEETNYKVINRRYDRIDYKVNPDNLESNTNFLIEKLEIDGAKCTQGNENDSIKVIRKTNFKENQYTIEIVEADTWIASYKHNYEAKKTEDKTDNSNIEQVLGEYKETRNDTYTEANQIREEINKNSNISEFQKNKIKEFGEKNTASININIISTKDETGKEVDRYIKISSNKIMQTILGDDVDLGGGRDNKYNYT